MTEPVWPWQAPSAAVKKWDWLRAGRCVFQEFLVVVRCLSQFFHSLSVASIDDDIPFSWGEPIDDRPDQTAGGREWPAAKLWRPATERRQQRSTGFGLV